MKKFSEYISEETKEIAFTFGRMNPPTVGHEKLLDALAKQGKKYAVYLSQSQDKKKNPLTHETKVKYARKMFPRHARSIYNDKDVKTVFDVLVKLYDQGYNKVTMVVGSDRVAEFKALVNKYNGEQARHGFYNFEGGIKIVSAGERDPDADDVSGMSASKMRAAAASGDFESFMKGLPSGFSEAKKLFNDIRTAMGIKESATPTVKFRSISEQREAYVAGDLFHKGDTVIIRESSEVATIAHCGSNFVLIETNDGKRFRKWLEDVELLEGERNSVDDTL